MVSWWGEDLLAGKSELLAVGTLAPDFIAKDGSGSLVSLKALTANSRVVLVFYPGDNTPVCTKQLCAFRDSYDALASANTVVLGINPAGAGKHSDFSTKYKFQFPLVVDESGAIAASYGCRAIFGLIKRSVYVVDVGGKILYAERGNPPVAEILAQLGTV